MSDSLHGGYNPHGLLAHLARRSVVEPQQTPFLPATQQPIPRATPRLPPLIVKKASAYPNAAAARSATRRPSVTQMGTIGDTPRIASDEDTADVPPPLIRSVAGTVPDVIPRA